MRPKIVPLCNHNLAKIAASKGLRVNGRDVNDFRNFQVNFGKSVGFCEVVMEPGTRVIAQVSGSIGEPYDSRPGEGVLTISAWISPSATGEMAGSGSSKPALIARAIEKMFKEHKAIDMASLCVKFGEKVWILRVDIHVLDMNGCTTEAATMATLGALTTFERPHAYVDRDTNELVVLSLEESTPVKLHLAHHPAVTSFVLTPCGKFLAEPDEDEEEIFPGKFSVGITDSKELCYLNLTNPVSQDLIKEAIDTAQTKCLERINWMKERVAEIERHRNLPVYERRKVMPQKHGKVYKISELANSDTANDFQNLSLLNSKKTTNIQPLKDVQVVLK